MKFWRPLRSNRGDYGNSSLINLTFALVQTTMQRHRLIYGALSDELGAGVHALSLHTKTPAEIEKAASRQ